jgi:4-amino-4-deoxy-L-arabinose transferase-like glycosyltransferase
MAKWLNPRREMLLVALILVGYVFLAVAFSFGPILEGPDEIHHFHYIYTLTQTGALPDPLASDPEYHQAPLYYLLAAPLATLINATDFSVIEQHFNPFSPYAITEPGNDNKNIFFHPKNEAFPYQNSPTARLTHLIRLLSIGLGLCTVLCSYGVFRLIWPDRIDRRLIAFSIIAFWPRFVYLSSTINNDNLLYLLATVTLYLLLRLQRDGLNWRSAALLGITLGLTLLTKVSAVFLVFPVGIGLLFVLCKDWRALRFIPLIGLMVVLIAGWWYLHNWLQFGDPTLVSILPPHDTEIIQSGHVNLLIGLQNMPWAYQTLWARFGEDRIPVSDLLLRFFDGLVILAFAGIVSKGIIQKVWRRVSDNSQLLVDRNTPIDNSAVARQWGVIVVVFALAWVGALLYYASVAWNGNQGRYLLPGVAGWAAMLAYGLDTWLLRRWCIVATLSFGGVLAVITFISVFGYFLPAYAVLPVPETIDQPLALRFGNAAELIGSSPVNPKGHPGDTIHITLYWRAIAPTSISLQTYLHTVDSTVVQRDSFPGTGNLLSTDWQPGQTWAESYIIPIPITADVQQTYPLVAGLYDPVVKAALSAANAAGNQLTPIIGRIAVNGPSAINQPKKAYILGDSIGLAEPAITRTDNAVQVCLNWLPQTSVINDYREFIHVFAADGTLIAAADAQPKQGQYPTNDWASGESIPECNTLTVTTKSSGDWTVAMGLYDSQTKDRLNAQTVSGVSLPDKSVIITAKAP